MTTFKKTEGGKEYEFFTELKKDRPAFIVGGDRIDAYGLHNVSGEAFENGLANVLRFCREIQRVTGRASG